MIFTNRFNVGDKVTWREGMTNIARRIGQQRMGDDLIISNVLDATGGFDSIGHIQHVKISGDPSGGWWSGAFFVGVP